MVFGILAIIAAAAVGCALGAAIILIILNWSKIINWFHAWQDRHGIKNKDEVAFTIHKALTTGKHKVIQGIFNKDTNVVEEGIQYEAERLDSRLAEAHKNDEVVTYE